MADLQNRVCFGSLEVDLRTHEVWNDGVPLKLTGQPFEVLAVLLTRPGELVTRDEFRVHLWGIETSEADIMLVENFR